MDIVNEHGFKVSSVGEIPYPGSCGQCEMKNRGTDSVIVHLTPEMVLKFCNVCLNESKEKLEFCMEKLEKERLHFKQSLCIPNGPFYDEGWRICDGYKVYCKQEDSVVVPMIKNDTIRWIKKEDLFFLNSLSS